MKLREIITDEKMILQSPMCEMANLFPQSTGLKYAIWFGEVGGQHGPRIKVSNIKGKFSQTDNFVISVDKKPKLLTPSSMKIKKNDLDDLYDWVLINYDILMMMWDIYESGNGDLVPLLASLRKI